MKAEIYKKIKKNIKNLFKKHLKRSNYDLRFQTISKDLETFNENKFKIFLYSGESLNLHSIYKILENIEKENIRINKNKILLEYNLEETIFSLEFNLYNNKNIFEFEYKLNKKECLYCLIDMCLKYYEIEIIDGEAYFQKKIKILDSYENIIKFFNFKSIIIEAESLTTYELFLYIVRSNYIDKEFLTKYIEDSDNHILKKFLNKYSIDSYFDENKLIENKNYINSKIERVISPEKVGERLLYGMLDFYEIIYKKLLEYATKKEKDISVLTNLYIRYVNVLLETILTNYRNKTHIQIDDSIYLEILSNKAYSLNGSERLFKLYNKNNKDYLIFGFKPNVSLDYLEFSINIVLENESEYLEGYINIFLDFLVDSFKFNFKWYIDKDDLFYEKSIK